MSRPPWRAPLWLEPMATALTAKRMLRHGVEGAHGHHLGSQEKSCNLRRAVPRHEGKPRAITCAAEGEAVTSECTWHWVQAHLGPANAVPVFAKAWTFMRVGIPVHPARGTVVAKVHQPDVMNIAPKGWKSTPIYIHD